MIKENLLKYNSMYSIPKRVYPCPVIVQLQHKIEWSCAICSWMKSWSNTQSETTTNEKHTQNDGRQRVWKKNLRYNKIRGRKWIRIDDNNNNNSISQEVNRKERCVVPNWWNISETLLQFGWQINWIDLMWK